MRINNINHLKSIISDWDGEIVIDAYEVEPPRGYAIISLTHGREVVHAINFEGTDEDMLFLFTQILRKNIEKIVEEQREEIVKFESP